MSVRNQRKQALANNGQWNGPCRSLNAPSLPLIQREEPISDRGIRRAAETSEYKENCLARKRQTSPHPKAKAGVRGLFHGPSKRAQGMGREAWCKMMEGT